MKPLKDFTGFTLLDEKGIEEFVKTEGLAMSKEDLLMVQDYFKNPQHRDPIETEIKVLDTYWSDHCRHTTFETCLKSIEITTDRFKEDIQKALELYLKLRTENKEKMKRNVLENMKF